MIEVQTSGMLNSVQDLGRAGYLDVGVSTGGAMDTLALRLGNALLGNEPGAAAIEVALFPFRLCFHRPAEFAVTGADCAATLDGIAMPPCWSRSAAVGQVLALSPPRRGARAYVCVRGGLDVPMALGSRSTDQKNGFGGLDGRGLMRGDRLPVLGAHPRNAPGLGAWLAELDYLPGTEPATPLRVVPAAQAHALAPEMTNLFYGTDWSLTPDANRMGFRFRGPALQLMEPMELFSHGIVPGTIQLPRSGQPLIQLADANTCGGYPKLATVIEADLWRLAQARVGGKVRFVQVTRDAGIETLREQFRQIEGVVRQAARLHAAA